MKESKADIKTYKDNEPGEISFQRKDIKAEIQGVTLNSANMVYVPGGADFKKDKIIILILRGTEA